MVAPAPNLPFLVFNNLFFGGFPTADVKVDSVSIGLPPFVYSYTNDQIGSFIDSGTGVFLLGPQAYASFVDTFQVCVVFACVCVRVVPLPGHHLTCGRVAGDARQTFAACRACVATPRCFQASA